MHALDLQKKQIVYSLPSANNKIIGLAWDGDKRQFWVSVPDKRVVYAAKLDDSIRAGKLELGREFSGHYQSLAFQGGHLWGVDTDRKQICEICVAD